MRHQPCEQAAAVGAAHDIFDMVFRMRHHAEHVAALVDDAGDRLRRAVDVGAVVDHPFGGAVAIEHPPIAPELLQRLFYGSVVAFTMGDGSANDLPGVVAACEGRVGSFDRQMHIMADELQSRIAHQHAGQKAGLAENLKTVADAEHQAPAGSECAYRIHHWRARRDRAAAQVIAIGKSAGHHHEIGTLRQRRLGVPDHRGFMTRRQPQRARHVALAIDSGKDDNDGFHRRGSLAQDLDPVILYHRVRHQLFAAAGPGPAGRSFSIRMPSRFATSVYASRRPPRSRRKRSLSSFSFDLMSHSRHESGEISSATMIRIISFSNKRPHSILKSTRRMPIPRNSPVRKSLTRIASAMMSSISCGVAQPNAVMCSSETMGSLSWSFL